MSSLAHGSPPCNSSGFGRSENDKYESTPTQSSTVCNSVSSDSSLPKTKKPTSDKYMRSSKVLEAPEIPAKLSKVKATKNNAAYQLTDAVSKLQEIAEITNYEEDQFSKFANHIASQFRELPLTHSIILQDKIQHLVTLERRNALASSTSQSF